MFSKTNDKKINDVRYQVAKEYNKIINLMNTVNIKTIEERKVLLTELERNISQLSLIAEKTGCFIPSSIKPPEHYFRLPFETQKIIVSSVLNEYEKTVIQETINGSFRDLWKHQTINHMNFYMSLNHNNELEKYFEYNSKIMNSMVIYEIGEENTMIFKLSKMNIRDGIIGLFPDFASTILDFFKESINIYEINFLINLLHILNHIKKEQPEYKITSRKCFHITVETGISKILKEFIIEEFKKLEWVDFRLILKFGE